MIKNFLIALWRNIQFFVLGFRLPWKYGASVRRMALVYQDLDRALAKLRVNSGLECPSGCGQCCEHVYAEVSVLEMLPMAMVLIERKAIDQWLMKLKNLPDEGRCVFYRSNSIKKGDGYCTIYPLRPLICRLFGFAAKKTKYGAQIMTCALMKSALVRQYAKANEYAASGKEVAFIDEIRDQIVQIDESLGRKMYPLPQALYKAMMIIGLERQIKKK